MADVSVDSLSVGLSSRCVRPIGSLVVVRSDLSYWVRTPVTPLANKERTGGCRTHRQEMNRRSWSWSGGSGYSSGHFLSPLRWGASEALPRRFGGLLASAIGRAQEVRSYAVWFVTSVWFVLGFGFGCLYEPEPMELDLDAPFPTPRRWSTPLAAIELAGGLDLWLGTDLQWRS